MHRVMLRGGGLNTSLDCLTFTEKMWTTTKHVRNRTIWRLAFFTTTLRLNQ